MIYLHVKESITSSNLQDTDNSPIQGVLSLLRVGKGNTIILIQLLWWWFIALLLLTNIYKSPYTTLYFLKSSVCIFTLRNLTTEFTSVCFEDLTWTALWSWRVSSIHPSHEFKRDCFLEAKISNTLKTQIDFAPTSCLMIVFNSKTEVVFDLYTD
jgi:hypothetical protein